MIGPNKNGLIISDNNIHIKCGTMANCQVLASAQKALKNLTQSVCEKRMKRIQFWSSYPHGSWNHIMEYFEFSSMLGEFKIKLVMEIKEEPWRVIEVSVSGKV